MAMPEAPLTPGCCPRRRWGNTGLSIPVIPFGTQGFGNNFGPVSDEQAIALIRRAVDLGVNHFDCARCYGDSMRKLGLAITQGVVKRDEVIISGRLCCHSAAQWGGYGKGEADYSAERAIADVQDQLARLGTDYFDAMLIHDPTAIEPTLAPDGCLDGLKRLKADGLVRSVGYGMNPHPFHLKAIAEGDIDVLLTFNDYNLFRQTAADEVLPAAANKSLGVLNGWSIKRGLLTGRPVEEVVPRDTWQPGSDPERAEAMRLWCAEHEISLIRLALQFCLREGRIHGNPLGNLTIDQLEMNVAAVLNPLPDAIFEEFRAAHL
ncbi:MAG: aldo/keto reductase [Candidatus Latescibacteria bacterium]|nr:aldo/keto reductase [Candidatus Latescibacterota bacterium]